MLNDIYNSLDPIAFSFGSVSVRWYGLAYIAGLALAPFIMRRLARRWGLRFSGEDALTFICYCAFGIIIGARVGYCVIYGNGYYLQNPLEVLALSNGGMSFHGGMVGLLVAGFLFARSYKMPFLSVCDLAVCAVPVGLFFGRVANFINGELYGAETTLPWGVDFTGTGTLYHPSQLYEAGLEGVLIFLLLMLLARRVPARPQGTFLGAFLIAYGICRIAVEFVRLPDSQMGYFCDDWLTMGQILCLPMLIAGIVLVLYAIRTQRPQLGTGV